MLTAFITYPAGYQDSTTIVNLDDIPELFARTVYAVEIIVVDEGSVPVGTFLRDDYLPVDSESIWFQEEEYYD